MWDIAWHSGPGTVVDRNVYRECVGQVAKERLAAKPTRARQQCFDRRVKAVVGTAAAVAITLHKAGCFRPNFAFAQTIPPPQGSVSPEGNYAYSGTFSYDPATCSRYAGGMVYLAVGRRVLRQPMENLGSMNGGTTAMRRERPHVRHPEEPVGCPDHPDQTAVYYLSRI